jgi:hypothetical protein
MSDEAELHKALDEIQRAQKSLDDALRLVFQQRDLRRALIRLDRADSAIEEAARMIRRARVDLEGECGAATGGRVGLVWPDRAATAGGLRTS